MRVPHDTIAELQREGMGEAVVNDKPPRVGRVLTLRPGVWARVADSWPLQSGGYAVLLERADAPEPAEPINAELVPRSEALVRQLRYLMETSAQAIAAFSSHGKPESRAPAGAQPDKHTDEWGGPYDPDSDPLLLWFLWRWNRARTNHERLAAVVEGELRLQRRRRRMPGRIAGAMNTAEPEAEEVRDDRIATAYHGLSPVEVAVIETELRGYCSQANVRKVRLLAGRDPETGHERQGLDSERAYALELRRMGQSIGAIAVKIGRPKATVQSWLKAAQDRAA